jgi:alpha-L-rhamnosidase
MTFPMSRKHRVTFIVALLMIWPRTAKPQESLRESTQWKAQWITSPSAPARDQAVLHFRKLIDLPARPEHFIVNVSADNQFILFVNGQRAGNGPARSDLAHWRYESYDLAPYLRAGQNVLAATVWSFGAKSAIAQMSDRIGFLVHGAGASERVADTDPGWEAEIEPAIQVLPPDVRGYYAAEPGVRFNGAAFDWNFTSNSRRSAWQKAVPLGRGSLRGETDAPNNWQLVSDPLPSMEMKLMKAGSVVRSTGVKSISGFPEKEVAIPPHSRASILLDNGQLTTAYPALTVSGGRGAKVRFTYAEALLDNNREKGNRNQISGKHIEGLRDEFLPGGCKSCEFIPLGWRTWRFLQLDVQTADQPLRIEKLNAWFTAYPFLERAKFSADDETLLNIWGTGWRTARLDAHDTYMDTPYWERLQYVGDTRIQALISYTVGGDDRLGRQAIEAFDHSRIPDGLTQSRYPSSLVQMIPTFSLLWIGMVHDFWQYRGDAEFVRGQLAGTRAVLDWYIRRQRPDGLLGKLPWWPFLDWGKDFEFGMPPQDEDGGSAPITLQFIEALNNSAELEEVLGDPRIAQDYRKTAAAAIDGVRKLCWNQEYGLIADTPAQKHFSQHANILGVWLDVIPAGRQKDVLTRTLSASDSGFKAAGSVPPMTTATYYFRFYLARALQHAGMSDRYLDLLGPWKQMLSLGLTTWAESPEPTRSDSHAWSAHPNYDLLTIVAGVRPKSAGFQTVTIEPHLGSLNHVSAAMPIPAGMIQVEYSRQGTGVEANIVLPTGVSGTFVWNSEALELHAGEQKLTLQ